MKFNKILSILLILILVLNIVMPVGFAKDETYPKEKYVEAQVIVQFESGLDENIKKYIKMNLDLNLKTI